MQKLLVHDDISPSTSQVGEDTVDASKISSDEGEQTISSPSSPFGPPGPLRTISIRNPNLMNLKQHVSDQQTGDQPPHLNLSIHVPSLFVETNSVPPTPGANNRTDMTVLVFEPSFHNHPRTDEEKVAHGKLVSFVTNADYSS